MGRRPPGGSAAVGEKEVAVGEQGKDERPWAKSRAQRRQGAGGPAGSQRARREGLIMSRDRRWLDDKAFSSGCTLDSGLRGDW